MNEKNFQFLRYLRFTSIIQAWRKRGGGRGGTWPPDFGRSEGAAGQRWRAALLLAHPDFQSLRHPYNLHTARQQLTVYS